MRTSVDAKRWWASMYSQVARSLSTKRCERMVLGVRAAEIQESANDFVVSEIRVGSAPPGLPGAEFENGFLDFNTKSNIGRVVRMMH